MDKILWDFQTDKAITIAAAVPSDTNIKKLEKYK